MKDTVSEKSGTYEVIRDDGYVTTEPIEQYMFPIDKWSISERRVITETYGQVLNIGCGAGHVLRYLHRKRINLVSLTISRGAVKITCCSR